MMESTLTNQFFIQHYKFDLYNPRSRNIFLLHIMEDTFQNHLSHCILSWKKLKSRQIWLFFCAAANLSPKVLLLFFFELFGVRQKLKAFTVKRKRVREQRNSNGK